MLFIGVKLNSKEKVTFNHAVYRKNKTSTEMIGKINKFVLTETTILSIQFYYIHFIPLFLDLFGKLN